ncbi:MAG: NHL repeat-containing protein [Thermoleophilaceae bacterium]
MTLTLARIIRPLALAAAGCALAAPAPAAAISFEADGAIPGFAQPTGVATDDAGRVYVADTARGRVEIHGNARSGNALLRTLGDDVLDCPVGIRIDNRGRIYVADACLDRVVMFDSYVDDGTVRRTFGGTGQAFGQMDDPRFLAVDRSARVHVAERGNVRVQSWRPSGGRQVPVSAFGVAQPPTFLAPEGLVRDAAGRVYVSDDSAADGEVRVFDRRGLHLETIAGPGSGPGQVSAPRGLARDPLGRLLVADSGNGRVQVYALPTAVETGEDGAGADDEEAQQGRVSQAAPGARYLDALVGLSRPADAAVAPGAMLYVADPGSGRVLRFRYDDADRDGALDGRDTCPGLPDPVQRDTDRDGAGDECDADDDGDGIPDAADACPRTRRGSDANGDGCGDPRSRISAPRDRKVFRARRPPSRLVGRASADELGVASVQYALARVRGRRCAWYTGRRFGRPRSCSRPVWLDARGAGRWEARVRIRGRGSYRLLSRAIQSGGVTESTLTRQNTKRFRVR